MDFRNLAGVSKYTVVLAEVSTDETMKVSKDFVNLQEALHFIEEAQAPTKYLQYHYGGNLYTLYPTAKTREFTVKVTPTIN